MHAGVSLRKVFDKPKNRSLNLINRNDDANFPAVYNVFTADK